MPTDVDLERATTRCREIIVTAWASGLHQSNNYRCFVHRGELTVVSQQFLEESVGIDDAAALVAATGCDTWFTEHRESLVAALGPNLVLDTWFDGERARQASLFRGA